MVDHMAGTLNPAMTQAESAMSASGTQNTHRLEVEAAARQQPALGAAAVGAAAVGAAAVASPRLGAAALAA